MVVVECTTPPNEARNSHDVTRCSHDVARGSHCIVQIYSPNSKNMFNIKEACVKLFENYHSRDSGSIEAMQASVRVL